MRLFTFLLALLALPAWAGSPGEAQAQKLEADIVKVIEGVMHEQ